MIPMISIIAYSGTGKTTFLEKLIPELMRLGITTAVVKHDAHDFQIDKEGKDSYRITQAGAAVTGLISQHRAVLMENRQRPIEEFIENVKDVDLILTEGFKTGNWPKIMLNREATGKGMPLMPEDCMAVVSDVAVDNAKAFFDLNDATGVATFIADYLEKSREDKKNNPLRNVPFLNDVKDSTIQGLWNDGHVEEFRKGSVLIKARSNSDSVYIQLTGKSAVYSLTFSGEKKVIFVLGPGNLLNDHIMTDHTPSVYCEIIEKGKVFVISKKKFMRWMEKDFSFTKAVLITQERKMWRMGHQLKNTNGSIFLERKLAAKLWKLSRDFGIRSSSGIEIDINMSITFLADMLGAPRETTSRLCKSLSDQGLISIHKKRITVTDPDHLSQLYKKGKIE